MTSKKYFMDNGISDFTISNLVSPALRNNYGQNASVNAFVGMYLLPCYIYQSQLV